MAIVDYNDPRDLPPIDYDRNKVPKAIKDRADGVREAKYGKQNKEFLAQNSEIAGIYAGEAKQLAERTQIRQDAVEDFNNQVIQEMTDKDVISAPEIIEARGGKPSLKARLDETTAQLAQITAYNPDNFEGDTDAKKIQACIDYALSDTNDHVTVQLYRDFDVTGSTININKPLSPRRNIKFVGHNGGISKHDTGFIFNRTQEGISYDVIFDNMNFRSTSDSGTTVFNGDKIMIVTDSNSNYWYVDRWVKAWSYVQSLKTHAQKIVGGAGSFIEIGAAYDCDFDVPLVESRKGNYFEQTRTPVGDEHRSLKGVYFRRPVIEGLEGYAIKLFRSEQVVIDSPYFEHNEGGDIVIDPLGLTMSLVVSNTMGHIPAGVVDKKPLIKWGGEVQWAHTYNNRNNNGVVHDTTSVVGTSNIVTEHDLSTGIALENIDPEKRLNYFPKKATDLISIEHKNTTVVLPKNTLTKVEVPFSRPIGLFDVVALQSQGTTGSQNYAVHSHHRDDENPNIYKIYLINNDEIQESMEVEIFLSHWVVN